MKLLVEVDVDTDLTVEEVMDVLNFHIRTDAEEPVADLSRVRFRRAILRLSKGPNGRQCWPATDAPEGRSRPAS